MLQWNVDLTLFNKRQSSVCYTAAVHSLIKYIKHGNISPVALRDHKVQMLSHSWVRAEREKVKKVSLVTAELFEGGGLEFQLGSCWRPNWGQNRGGERQTWYRGRLRVMVEERQRQEQVEMCHLRWVTSVGQSDRSMNRNQDTEGISGPQCVYLCVSTLNLTF